MLIRLYTADSKCVSNTLWISTLGKSSFRYPLFPHPSTPVVAHFHPSGLHDKLGGLECGRDFIRSAKHFKLIVRAISTCFPLTWCTSSWLGWSSCHFQRCRPTILENRMNIKLNGSHCTYVPKKGSVLPTLAFQLRFRYPNLQLGQSKNVPVRFFISDLIV